MKRFTLILALLAAPGLAGCTSTSGGDGSQTSADGTMNRFQRSSDTLGTQRRMDVFGGATAPVLPTMGAVGYGK